MHLQGHIRHFGDGWHVAMSHRSAGSRTLCVEEPMRLQLHQGLTLDHERYRVALNIHAQQGISWQAQKILRQLEQVTGHVWQNPLGGPRIPSKSPAFRSKPSLAVKP
jgi:hypothetical protein